MIKKWSALLLALAMVLSLAACSSKPNADKDAATVVAEVGDAKITKGEALSVYDFVLKQIVSMYMSSGMAVTADDPQLVASAKETTLSLMSEGIVLEKQLDTLGIGLNDEDLAQIETDAVAQYDEMIGMYVSSYGETAENATAAAEEQGFTKEAFRFFARRDKVEAKLREVAVTDVAVTDEEIQGKYDELVASQEETYATTPSQYTTDVLNGTPIYVTPEGYRYIKNLVVALPDDISQQVSAKQSEQYTAMYELYSLQNQLSSQADLAEAAKKTIEDQITVAQANYDTLTEEIKTLTSQGREQVRAKAEEILALCQAPGADFDALIAEYSVDKPANDTIQNHGYPVSAASTSYVSTFTEGAMALTNIGDVSGLVESDYGFHILLYTGDITPGTTPLEAVRDAVSEMVLTTKQDDAFTAKKAEWFAATTVKTYPDKL